MLGGTDHGHDHGTEGHYAAGLLAQERASDVIYAVRSWARGLAWTSLLAAVGALCTALATKNWLAVAAACTGIVGVFLPQLNSTLVNEILKTALIRAHLVDRPAGESIILPLPPAKGRP